MKRRVEGKRKGKGERRGEEGETKKVRGKCKRQRGTWDGVGTFY